MTFKSQYASSPFFFPCLVDLRGMYVPKGIAVVGQDHHQAGLLSDCMTQFPCLQFPGLDMEHKGEMDLWVKLLKLLALSL